VALPGGPTAVVARCPLPLPASSASAPVLHPLPPLPRNVSTSSLPRAFSNSSLGAGSGDDRDGDRNRTPRTPRYSSEHYAPQVWRASDVLVQVVEWECQHTFGGAHTQLEVPPRGLPDSSMLLHAGVAAAAAAAVLAKAPVQRRRRHGSGPPGPGPVQPAQGKSYSRQLGIQQLARQFSDVVDTVGPGV
jgi:hypothetical protein